MPDELANAIKEAAGGKGKVSAWLTSLARKELLRAECAALAAWDREHRNSEWDAQDEADREHARAAESQL